MGKEFDLEGLKEKVKHLLYELENASVLKQSWGNIRDAMDVVYGIIDTTLQKTPEFPLYLMKADDEYRLLTLQEAGVLYDNGFMKVDFGHLVLEQGFKMRKMTEEEQREISRIADRHSDSK